MRTKKTCGALALLAMLTTTAIVGDAVADDAAWDGRFGSLGVSAPVYTVKIDGVNVYAGGAFTTAGGISASRIAKWNNANWSALGAGVSGDVYAIAIDGTDVYAGGAFTSAGGSNANHIAKWNGSSWSALGSGVSGDVRAIAVNGTDVYVGGTFTTAGGTTALRVARWNGSSWSSLGVGPSADVSAIGIDGSDIYVGGSFVTVDGMGASHIARWNGSSWSALGSGLTGDVNAIVISGSDIYVGGLFTSAGGSNANHIARWNGSSWSPLGSGLSGTVNAIGVDGPTVYAGGAFTTAGVLPADHVAMWDGSNWSSLGSGASDIVNSMDVAGGDTYVGGDFTVAGTKPSFYFGRYNPAIVAVFITSFEAEAEATGVHLRWDIFADENVLGFQIYRRAKGVAAYERLVDNLLPPMARAYIDTDAGFGATYDYVLGVTRADGTELTSPPTEVTTASLAVKLEQNYPNPFNPTTTIAITVPKEEHVTLTVVDMQGGVVARLFDGMLPAGDREFQWNGMDSRGNRVSSGVYFCRLRAGKAVRSEKMTLLK